ncbi:MAG TPA: DNA-3-methyladenine glycosylase I [Acetobacteraceae bacterium]|nr:DNA-3-methyladenine glycosylase I [Acetobacteraceae bacterium]
MTVRCTWANSTPLLTAYHDEEWGVPHHDDRALFELLCLEGAQAGLSWETVLRKRDAYREAFAGFDPAVVAAFDAARLDTLMANPGIIRHRGKLEWAVRNARAVILLQQEFGSFDAWLWGFVDGVPQPTHRAPGQRAAATSPLSDRVSKELRRRGFGFVGSTIVQAYLQAAGLLDDHDFGCFRRLDAPAPAP